MQSLTQRRRRRRLSSSACLMLSAAVVLGAGGGAVFVARRLGKAAPRLSVSIVAPPTQAIVAEAAPPLTVPTTGSFALDTDIDGRVADRGADDVRPIASIAKTMTALVVLQAHPLAGTAEGPTLTMTQADVDLYASALAANGSSLPVALGERFTERQLLLGMMLPSANNFAETLALWVGAGDRAAFIARLNREARALGMGRTHFDDPSGLSAATVSTPADLVRLGTAALANAALAAIVGTAQAVLPGGMEVFNLNYLLTSQPGWLGIKTGDTEAAGSCLLFAERTTVAGSATPITMVGAVLGQASRDDALRNAVLLASTTAAEYTVVDPSTNPPPIRGSISSAWGDVAGVVRGGTPSGAAVARRGGAMQLVVQPMTVQAPLHAGDVVGHVRGMVGARVLVDWPVLADSSLAEPSPLWRLSN